MSHRHLRCLAFLGFYTFALHTQRVLAEDCPEPKFKFKDGQYSLSYGSTLQTDAKTDITTLQYCVESLDKHAFPVNWAGPHLAGWVQPGLPVSAQLPTMSTDKATVDSLLYYGTGQASLHAPYIPVQTAKPGEHLRRAYDPLINRIKVSLGNQEGEHSDFIAIDAEFASYVFPLANGQSAYIYQWRNIGPIIQRTSDAGKTGAKPLSGIPFRWRSDAVLKAYSETARKERFLFSLTGSPEAVVLQSELPPRRDTAEVEFLGGIDAEKHLGGAMLVMYVPSK